MITGFVARKIGPCGSGVCQLSSPTGCDFKIVTALRPELTWTRPHKKTHYCIESKSDRVGVDLTSLFEKGGGVNNGSVAGSSGEKNCGEQGKAPVEGGRKLETLVPEGFTQFPTIRRRSEIGRLHPSGRTCPLVSRSLDRNTEEEEKRGWPAGQPLAKRPGGERKVSSRHHRGGR